MTTDAPIRRNDWLQRLMASVGKALVALALAGLCAFAVAWGYVRWYVYRQGVPLSDLSDDYGLAFDIVILAATVFVVVLVSALGLMWARRRPK